MHINQLRYFVSVASCRSFTRAAESHFLTQTAITQQVKALEDSLGVQLIDRHRRPIELTPAGIVFYQEAKAILERMDAAVAKAQEASTGTAGTIRIGYEKGFERSDLSDRLRAFRRAYPNILFSCFREDTDTLSEKLLTNDLDVIFAWDSTNLRSKEDVECRLDTCSRLSVALYSSHPYAARKSLRRQDLRDENILFMTPSRSGDSFGDMHYMELYKKAGYEPKIILKSNDIESLLIMVAAEEGISVLPSYIVEKLVSADHIVFLPLDGEDEYEDIFMFWKSSHSNSALQCFLNHMHE